VPISLAALLPGARMVVVTTPQEAARTVAERAGRMAQRSHLELAGVIENMACLVCPCCGEELDVFGRGGGEQLARDLGVALLARVPLDPDLRAAGDAGVPAVLRDPQSPAAVAFREAAAALGHPRTPVPLPLPLVPATVAGGLGIEGSVHR
jgi:ATP-binding protein involved in chromosome partitioning